MDRFSLCALMVVLLPVKCLHVGDSCIADDQPGTCSRLSDCKPLLDEIRRAGRPMPIHLKMKLIDRSCGFESMEPVVCCTPLSRDPVVIVTKGVTSNPTDGKSASGGDGKDNLKTRFSLPNVENHPNLRLLPTKTCGIFKENRISGGNVTDLLEMPWMVLLAYNSPEGRKLSCGGTLINERYVLTAAHCVSFLGERLKLEGVVLGEHDVRQDPDCDLFKDQQWCAPNVRNFTVETAIVHKGYNPDTLVDDIALLRLSEPADLNLDNMKTICLPFMQKFQMADLIGYAGVVAGWGATEDGLQSSVLLKVDLPIVDNKECQEAYYGNSRIYERQLCAGGVQGKDSCVGDSGGPLLMFPALLGFREIQYVQMGIVSYGSMRCGLKGQPGVYTRIAFYMDWILDNMHE